MKAPSIGGAAVRTQRFPVRAEARQKDENRARATDWQRCTLELTAINHDRLRVYCEDCRRVVEVEPLALVSEATPADTPLWTVAQKLRCSSCGSTRVGLQIAGHKLGSR